MSKIIDAVSIVMTCGDEIFPVQRQFFLNAFPGYWAFPGGKVEPGDESFFLEHEVTKTIDPRLFGAAVREGQEELGVDFRQEILNGRISSVDYLGLAITPDFNPYRFATYFFKINFTTKVDFVIDRNEARVAEWKKTKDLLEEFNRGEILAVPPVVKVIDSLGKDPGTRHISDLNVIYDGSTETPHIESIRGIKQIMPLSHTLPPASRTNSFLIGDVKTLVDPSPKDEEEYRKFKSTIAKFGVDQIFLTHHHPDHYERSNQLARELSVPVLLGQDTLNRITKKTPGFFDGVVLKVVKDKDVVTNWLGQKVLVMEIPGHDEGQLALYPENRNWFLAGDLFQGVGTVVIGGEEGNMKKYFETLEKVIKLSPKVIFPSHGIGLGGTHVLEKTLEHRKLRESQILAFHQEGLSPDEMLPKIYAEVKPELWPYALQNIHKHLEKLKSEGKI
jgi:ribonuclease/clavin/mitogillin